MLKETEETLLSQINSNKSNAEALERRRYLIITAATNLVRKNIIYISCHEQISLKKEIFTKEKILSRNGQEKTHSILAKSHLFFVNSILWFCLIETTFGKTLRTRVT